MFAEELAGNPAKKRAEEAKNRRLRAKREKEAKDARKQKELERREGSVAAVAAETNPGHSTAVDDKSVSSVVVNGYSDAPVLRGNGGGASSGVKVTGSASDGPLTATQYATEQRKIRTEARLRNSSAVVIQSLVRSRQVTSNAKEYQRKIFDKRMSDLITLSSILENVQRNEGSSNSLIGKDVYIPPPATVSIMTVQFLFFAWTSVSQNECQDSIFDGTVILEEQDLPRFAKLIQYILLPGVASESQDLDPLLPWVETFAGRRRLTKILGLCISSISMRRRKRAAPLNTTNVDTSFQYIGMDSFLRRVLRLGDGPGIYTGLLRDEIHQISRSLFFQTSLSEDLHDRGGGVNYADRANYRRSCDLIRSLRFILHYGSDGNSTPIPHDCGQLRENCIACDEKDRISILFKLAVDYLSSTISLVGGHRSHFCSRFLVEVLTAPLLVWKVPAEAYGRMLLIPKSRATPPLVDYIHSFLALNAKSVSSGCVDVALLMRDVSLTSCPAPPVLCLLANLVQIGKQSVALNGSDPNKLHFTAAAKYFNFLTNLINAAPLGTFSRRMSAVEWIYIGSSSTPIVLSDVVVDQACALLADSYVRSLFKCAIDDDLLGTDKIIRTKSDKDKSYEKDLEDIGSESVASLAAKEAMVDRSRSFWQGSWAAKISRSVNSLISGPTEKMKSNQASSVIAAPTQLLNTSSIARQLAHGKGSVNRIVTSALLSSEASDSSKDLSFTTAKPDHEYSVVFLFALCKTYATIISRWGGGGKDDLVKRASSDSEKPSPDRKGIEQASGSIEPCVTALLSVISFSTSTLTTTWGIIQSNPRVVSDLYAVIDVNKRPEPIRSLDLGASEENDGAAVLFIFVSCLSHTLMVTDDVEIHDLDKPMPKHQLRRCILLLKKLLYRACCLDDVHKSTAKSKSNHFGLSLISRSSKVMNDLYSRSSRRLLCAPKFWIEDSLLETDLRRCKSHSDYIDLLASPVCRICPFLVSFKRRLKLFERIVTTNRVDIQGSNDFRNLKPGIMVKVMRGRVLEDGLIHLNNLGRNLRQRIVVNYLSQAGTKETGVDVGGLFKEFWTDLSNLAFDPNYALFRVTEGSTSLYPNPSSKLAHGSDHVILFEFLGRILGKALYEGITIQPQFAHLFLSFLRGDHQYLHLLTDLSTIDPELYNNLMFLKTYSGDVSDLCLTFTVANDDFGVSEVPLIPNGASIEVTNENKRRYIYLVAKHHVCDRIKEQSDAFTKGLWEVIDRSWLRLFNEPELQVLISGPSDGKIDISDMKSNTRYTGGYSVLDRNIIRFWSVVSSFTSNQQADLLRFVTSCERPPPLGFASMNPPFTIQRVGIMRDGDKLPTASTCFNTLKLPTYSSEKVLKEKLLYSIQAGAGFELT